MTKAVGSTVQAVESNGKAGVVWHTQGSGKSLEMEPRLVRVGLASDVTEEILDRAADEATVGLDDTARARIEASVAVVNAVYGAPQRIAALAADLVAHWENRRARMHKFIEAPGKAMIVGGAGNLREAILLDRGVAAGLAPG